MKDKICMVTGGNTGIGKETAIGLAKMGATIVLVCKNKSQGEETLSYISEISNNNLHRLILVDLADFESIRTGVDEFKSRFDRLDVLINNAGIFLTELQYSKNNIEKQFAVNHLAPFLLTNLLLNTILKTGNARIINLSSVSHYFGKINFDDLHFESRNYNGLRVYEQSKLAVLLFTYELARKLKDTNITVNAVDPGRVNTHIGNKNAMGIYKFLWILNKPLLTSIEKGAATSIFLATSDNVHGITGKYFKKCKIKKSSVRSYDEGIAKQLWEVSSVLSELTHSHYIR